MGRPYNAERDLAAVTRMWREVQWIDDSDTQAEALRDFLDVGATLVGDIDGEAECAVHRTPGSIRHGVVDLPLCAITAVTTSHVGRRQGLATRLTAQTVADGAAAGAAVAALGMFDQGFYDRFGFGAGAYEHSVSFDPATLTVPVPDRPPVRLTVDDAAEIHALLVRRHRGHGGVVLDPPATVSAEMGWTEGLFGLGFRDASGRLTHCMLGSAEDEHGPFLIEWLAYEAPAQILELLGLVRALGDQFALVTLAAEPPEIQLQDLLATPIRQRRFARLAGGSGALQRSMAEEQIRILDLRACIGAVTTHGPAVTFELRLHDPMADVADTPWPGIGGTYRVRLGRESTVDVAGEPGADADDVPVLEATVNAFSRAWMGVRPASGLALTDSLAGPPGLLADLDVALRMPPPFAGWSF